MAHLPRQHPFPPTRARTKVRPWPSLPRHQLVLTIDEVKQFPLILRTISLPILYFSYSLSTNVCTRRGDVASNLASNSFSTWQFLPPRAEIPTIHVRPRGYSTSANVTSTLPRSDLGPVRPPGHPRHRLSQSYAPLPVRPPAEARALESALLVALCVTVMVQDRYPVLGSSVVQGPCK